MATQYILPLSESLTEEKEKSALQIEQENKKALTIVDPGYHLYEHLKTVYQREMKLHYQVDYPLAATAYTGSDFITVFNMDDTELQPNKFMIQRGHFALFLNHVEEIKSSKICFLSVTCDDQIW